MVGLIRLSSSSIIHRGGFHKCKVAPPAHAANHSSPGGSSQVPLGVASEGVEAEVVINAVSSHKVLIIHHDVAKCHKTHFPSPPMAEPLADVMYGPGFHPYVRDLWQKKNT